MKSVVIILLTILAGGAMSELAPFYKNRDPIRESYLIMLKVCAVNTFKFNLYPRLDSSTISSQALLSSPLIYIFFQGQCTHYF